MDPFSANLKMDILMLLQNAHQKGFSELESQNDYFKMVYVVMKCFD